MLKGVNSVFSESNLWEEAKQPPHAFLMPLRFTDISCSPGEKLGLNKAMNVESIPALTRESFSRRAASPAPPKWPVDNCKIFIGILDALDKVTGKVFYSQ